MMLTNWTQKQKEASDALIRKGEFRHLLHSGQKKFHDVILQKYPKNMEFFLYSCRKLGKSIYLALFAIHHCLAKPNQLVRHVFPTFKLSKEVVYPIMSQITPFLPEELRPVLRRSEAAWYFNNGSIYRLGGSDPASIDGNRGPFMTALLADEVCFWDESIYEELIYSTLYPQMSLVEHPIVLYASTPPRNPTHPAIVKTLPKIQQAKCFVHLTVYDNPLIPVHRLERIKEECGGERSNAWRREYLAEVVADDSIRLTPEWSDKQYRIPPVVSTPLDPVTGEIVKYTCYTSMDIGLKDNTAILFAYMDYLNNQLVVVDEWVDNYQPLKAIAEAWYAGVKRSLEHLRHEEEEYRNVFDAHGIVANDLRTQYGLRFEFPSKRKLEDTIAFLRNAIQRGRIRVSSRCERLLWELNNACWDDKKNDIARNEEQSHGDALIALAYLVKKASFSHLPGSGSNRITLRKASHENIKSSVSPFNTLVRRRGFR